LIGKIGLIESRQGGKAFSQLYAALALRSFGADLNSNPLWQSLTPEEKTAWRSLLDVGRFYDRREHHVINLAENYHGVAARVATLSFQLGVETSRADVDDLLNAAAKQFTSGALFADDSQPTGRYDRYSQEYARYVYEAAETAGRKDLLQALEPTLKTQMRLWWDLQTPDGYGYPWGRSQGAIGYLDTMEIAAFLGEHPQFRPAPLEQLAGAYYAAWTWLRHDYNDQRHLLSVFAFGRGNYSYITPQREWQQTTSGLGKILTAHIVFSQALAREHITTIPPRATLADVQRFQWFRQGARPAGVWIVRRNGKRFAVPFTTGEHGAITDYLPAPHGLPGFAAPVEQKYPALVPYVELDDGPVIAAADGADEIRPAADGRSVTAVWKNWAIVGGKAAAFTDPGLRSEVTWTWDGARLRRSEVLTAIKPVHIRNWSMVFPSTFGSVATSFSKSQRSDVFRSKEGAVHFTVTQSPWPLNERIIAGGNSPLGRSPLGPIPLHLEMEASDVAIAPRKPVKFVCEIAWQ